MFFITFGVYQWIGQVMRNSYLYVAFCLGLLCILIYSCAPQSSKTSTRKVPLSIIDSINKLDSLVLVYRIANQPKAHSYARLALTLTSPFTLSHERAKALNMQAVTYILNKPDSALWYYQQALKIARKPEMLKTKMLILSNIGTLYSTYGEQNIAISYFDSILTCNENFIHGYSTSEVYIFLGSIYLEIGNMEKAQDNYQKSFEIATKQKNTKQIALSLANLATLKPDDSAALYQYQKALSLLGHQSTNLEEKASILVNLGLLQSNPQTALAYYKNALALAEHKAYPIIEMGAFNNMAYAYMDLGMYAEAEACLIDKALIIASELKDYQWLSTIHDSYADLLFLMGNYKDALASQKKALEYQVELNQQIASKQTRLLMAKMEEREKDFTIKQQANELTLNSKRNQLKSVLLLFALTLIIVLVLLLRIVRHRSVQKLQHQRLSAAKKLMEIEEYQKSKLGNELHDISGQLVMGLRGAVENMIENGIEEAPELKNRIMDIGQSIRRISHRMDQQNLHKIDLSELLNDLCKDTQTLTKMNINLHCPPKIPVTDAIVKTSIYRITQELITNGIKHSEAPVLYLVFEVVSQKQLNIYYEDEGKGFDSTNESNFGFGLQGIKQRAMIMGANCKINAQPSLGTKIELNLFL